MSEARTVLARCLAVILVFTASCCSDSTSCPDGTIRCDGTCTEVLFDDDNCGACDNACDLGLTCCGGRCTDTLTDSENCGSCGNACENDTSVCRSGYCVHEDDFDIDNDGYVGEQWGGDDCDDLDPDVNPGAPEVCGPKDDDCDGQIDEEPEATASCDDEDECTVNDRCVSGQCVADPLDGDGDGYGPVACGGDDCDDTSALANPGQTEGPEGDPTCFDHLDNDCNGDADEDDQSCRTPEVCMESGWCWQNPLPSGDDLRSAWAASSDDVWAVGHRGMVLRWDGTDWSRVDMEVTHRFRSVWGFSSDDVWVGGEGGIYHWNGLTWTRYLEDEAAPESIWGAAPDDVWAVGFLSTIHHWDGNTWSAVGVGTATGAFYSVRGTSSVDVWIVGGRSDQNVAYHWDGSYLRSSNTGGEGHLRIVWAISPSDVWAGGGAYVPMYYEDTLFHWDGTSWSPVEGVDDEIVTSIWATATDNVYAVGHGGGIHHWDGIAWTQLFSADPGLTYNGISGTRADDIWIVGDNGIRLHWDGADWSYIGTITTAWLNAVWGSSPDDVWSVGDDGTIVHHDGYRWTSVDSATSANLYAIWGSGPDDVWAVGSCALLHWDGVAWSPSICEESESFEFKGVWGSAADDVWVAGGDPGSREGIVLHWDGSSWSRVDGGGFLPFESIWVSNQNDIWAVGWAALICHWDGTSWSDFSSRWYGADLYDVWGSASDDVWAVGLDSSYPDGQILHWDGQTWSSVGFEHNYLRSVWGTAVNDVWAVGSDSYSIGDRAALHRDGIEWTKTPVETKQHLSDIWGTGNDMWIVGQGGVILHRRW
ncbi:MAG: hypothetical protein JXR96_00125 [Deltaproteobacteria bacterium]|nr:hypothetical protein [Deltaproteobacteria bacterium]